ncbi:MAG: MgtC/SapB family protein, partial [bacterium]
MAFELFKVFGEALALGLLIGSERYRGRGNRAGQTAGIRTFSIIALLGVTCAVLEIPGFTLITFGALVVFLVSGYWRETGEDLGLTTELAALLTFWLGYLTRGYETLAISTGIVVVILLASKKALHRFIRKQVSETEFFDTLKFLAVVFVVLPLLPNRYIGPFQFLNPTKIWMLIILISSISYTGYILIRLLGEKKGLAVNALLGGLFSTTAVTVSLADRARRASSGARLLGFAGVAANAVQ